MERGVHPRLDVRPPNPRQTEDPLPALASQAGSAPESTGFPSPPAKLHLSSASGSIPTGGPGEPGAEKPNEDAEPDGVGLQAPQPPAPPPLATKCASLGLESCENPPGALASHRTGFRC